MHTLLYYASAKSRSIQGYSHIADIFSCDIASSLCDVHSAVAADYTIDSMANGAPVCAHSSVAYSASNRPQEASLSSANRGVLNRRSAGIASFYPMTTSYRALGDAVASLMICAKVANKGRPPGAVMPLLLLQSLKANKGPPAVAG